MARKIRKAFNIISTVILILLIILVVLIFIARISGNSPSLFGYHVYRVQTDSMVPTLKVGDVILIKEAAAEDIHNGDIITYRCQSGELAGQMITHRVVEDPIKRDDVYYFHTKGDKVGASMDDEISYDQVQGKYVNTIPWIDKLYTFFLSPGGLVSFIVLIVILFGYEIISLIVSYKSLEEKDEDYYEPKAKKESKKRKKPKKTHFKK